MSCIEVLSNRTVHSSKCFSFCTKIHLPSLYIGPPVLPYVPSWRGGTTVPLIFLFEIV
jgi:hypothetical protein